ncbi:SAM-dependent methyltransferase [Catenuloplanes nepalensis]|uniref:SAM-dependent methyltransferase n=1 Tax=Catenuloplanes nepalensis TaxID=587533 RepID=A0ABT9MJB6_9ACTN|nr:class I SAM-dependent methyltransferase [Catenuloplanes nepalensis]MDP9791513.1 SAM-dependent methyltransferase [Catenuloplanes nepalensis]
MRGADIRSSAAVEERHWWYRERRALLARELRRRHAEPGRRAIEIGAAGGGNSLVMRDFGYDVLATEYLPEGVEIARARGLDAIQADARDLPVESASRDLLVAFDVLEHIGEDDRAAAEIHRVLRPGGTVLIAVPADMRLWSVFDELSGHVRRYDRAGLTALITDAGLRVDALWSWNVLLRPAVALRRTTTVRPSSEATLRHDVTAVHPLVNALLGGVVRLERHLPVGRLPGVSLFLRAHKPF